MTRYVSPRIDAIGILSLHLSPSLAAIGKLSPFRSPSTQWWLLGPAFPLHLTSLFFHLPSEELENLVSIAKDFGGESPWALAFSFDLYFFFYQLPWLQE